MLEKAQVTEREQRELTLQLMAEKSDEFEKRWAALETKLANYDDQQDAVAKIDDFLAFMQFPEGMRNRMRLMRIKFQFKGRFVSRFLKHQDTNRLLRLRFI